MKLIKAIAATACAFALATAAQAEQYTDSSADNAYADGWSSGSNGGEGFGAWVIKDHAQDGGWAVYGIWDPSANEFQGTWAGKTKAFGMIGKGNSCSVTASRSFRKALDINDSFALDMAVNWDSNAEGSKKGFVLTAQGAPILTVNHGAYPGHIYINDDDSNDALNNSGTYPMTWTFTAKDATTLSYTVTPRDGAELVTGEIAVSTSAIDGFILQSVEQDNQNEDRRQSYYDNFVLTIAGELPELTTLEFTSGEWAVSNATQSLSYSLKRSSTDGALDVTVSSSDESFVPATTVSFADGQEEVSFTLDATLTGSGNFAKLTASATGCDPATFEVKGPQYRVSVEKYEADPEETINFWMNWDNNGIALDEAKVTIEANPDGSLELPTEWTWTEEEGGAYVASSLKVISSGTLILKYDGVQFADYGVTVREPLVPGFELSGPQTAEPGQTCTYTLKATLTEEELGCTVSFDPADAATANPDSFDLADPAEDGFYYQDIEVTFGDISGDVTITVASSAPDGYSADINVTVTAPLDPSLFDDYVAYDEAALYGSFDPASTGAGEKGFEAWSVYQDEAENGGVYVGGYAPEALADIIENSKVLGLYANGTWENNNYKVYRGFGGDLEPGQEFAIDFACQATGGSRFVQLVRMWEGTGYPRFEVYTSAGFVGVNLEGFEGGDIGWASADRVVHVSVLRSADGATYTLSLSSGDDTWTKDVPASTENWGDGLQGVIIGAWNSGSDFFFNRMYIDQVEEPIVARTISWAAGVWNPDAAGEYQFAISATTDDIGEVALSVEPSDGALSLSTDTVDLTGVTEASFSVTLSEANEGASFVITATPADTTVAPIEYNVTVASSHVTLSCDNWEYPVSAGSIWLALTASVSKYGTYTISSSDESVLTVPDTSVAITVNSPDQSWFDVNILAPGTATIYATAEGAETPAAEYGFTITDVAPSIDETTVKDVSFSGGFSATATDEFAPRYTDAKALVGIWNPELRSWQWEAEPRPNEAQWPEMKFTIPPAEIPAGIIQLIFE